MNTYIIEMYRNHPCNCQWCALADPAGVMRGTTKVHMIIAVAHRGQQFILTQKHSDAITFQQLGWTGKWIHVEQWTCPLASAYRVFHWLFPTLERWETGWQMPTRLGPEYSARLAPYVCGVTPLNHFGATTLLITLPCAEGTIAGMEREVKKRQHYVGDFIWFSHDLMKTVDGHGEWGEVCPPLVVDLDVLRILASVQWTRELAESPIARSAVDPLWPHALARNRCGWDHDTYIAHMVLDTYMLLCGYVLGE